MYKSSTVDSVASPAHGVGTDSGLNDRESVGLDEAVGKLLQVKFSYGGVLQNVLSSGDSTEEEKMLLLAAVLKDEENLGGGVIFSKPALRLFNMEPQLRYAYTQPKMAQDESWKKCPDSNRKKHSTA
uniref:(California timema) hypothetical protein n=1 Tax=Timema californicum TaxID=61474 RepID=A0A7R9IZD6_TIMCA|nr:unnamed protein product [Timema californicum]